MRILADENIPCVSAAFAPFGTLNTFVGRKLTAAQVKTADVLLVRSVTPVNAALLAGSGVRFVGTATIGLDHIDQAYLAEQHIGFASAPASNARSAAEYVVSALCVLAQQQGFDLTKKTMGIIGCGNVGSRVLKLAQALGLRCVVNDPPKQRRGELNGVDLVSALQCDIVTVHVPLETAGDDPTVHLLNRETLAHVRPDAILINTARGATMDGTALLARLTDCPALTAVLDVWPQEPLVPSKLLAKVAIATPHIAGYSLDGKARATELLHQAFCRHFGFKPCWQARDSLPPADLTALYFSAQADFLSCAQTAVLACYDVRRDDGALRKISQNPQPATYFDQLRKHYPVRREFASVQVQSTHAAFRQLGFT
jgi:erythronate-4-phosphate dehydrogenase